MRSLEKFVASYESIARGTGDAPIARKAAARVEEALIEVMRAAADELAGTPPKDRTLEIALPPANAEDCARVREFISQDGRAELATD